MRLSSVARILVDGEKWDTELPTRTTVLFPTTTGMRALAGR
jgi:hypothetical protein